jgi:transposase
MEVGEMLAQELDFVIGVDTHADSHTLAVVAAPSGGLLGQQTIATTVRGYDQALRIACAQAPGRRAWALEGSGSYGAGLARFLAARGERVLEVERPTRRQRRRGKSDGIDALAAARCALGQKRWAQPRAGGQRAELAALVSTREGAMQARRAALCQLRALLLALPPERRERLAGLTRTRLLERLAALRPRTGAALDGLELALRSLARRVQALDREERALKRQITVLVNELAAWLLAEPGIGPITAAQLLIPWSHPGRLWGESAFARLGGAAPIPASSGKVVRHRLDRGGDRQLNRALHTIVINRRKHHPPTIAYIARRNAEGKSEREAIRCLKRYLARSLFRKLEAMPAH